jgi:predicted DNA-binding transcriptional regulator AlpA
VQQNTQQNLTIIRLPDVKKKTSLSESTILRLEAKGLLPARVKIGRSTGWYEHEINAFLACLPRA